jgi:hypothetical protein
MFHLFLHHISTNLPPLLNRIFSQTHSAAKAPAMHKFLSLPYERFKNLSKEDYDKSSCRICFALAHEPTTPGGCGHIYCRSCIRQALQTKSECPTCKQPATLATIQGNCDLQSQILAYQIACHCGAILPLSSIQAHSMVCPKGDTTCRFWGKGCNELVPKDLMQEHNVQCWVEQEIKLSEVR